MLDRSKDETLIATYTLDFIAGEGGGVLKYA